MKISSLNYNFSLKNRYNKLKLNQNANTNPISFKGFDCAQDYFEVKKLYDVPCPVCATPMIKRKQLDEFIDSTEDKTGEQLIEALEKYDRFYHPTEKKAVETIKAIAKKEPEKNIADITYFHAKELFSRARNSQIEAVKKIKELNRSNSGYSRDAIARVIEKYERILMEGENVYFKEDDLRDELAPYIEAKTPRMKRINGILDKLPDTQDGEFLFFLKNAKNPQRNISYHLLNNSTVTCEHIKAKSLGGKDNTANYLAECFECNTQRNNTSFYEWSDTKPNLKATLQGYLNFVFERFRQNELPSTYSSYFEDIKKTVSDETKGKIKLEVPKKEGIEQEKAQEFDVGEITQETKDEISALKDGISRFSALKEKYENDPEFLRLMQYLKLREQKEGISLENNKKSLDLEEQRRKIDRYYKKSKERQQKIDQLNTQGATMSQKDLTSLKSKISALGNYLHDTNIQELEAEYSRLQGVYSKAQKEEQELDTSLAKLGEEILFPAMIKSSISDLNLKIAQINSSYLRIKELEDYFADELALARQIEEKEGLIASLNGENQQITSQNPSFEDTSEYNKLKALLPRIDEVKKEYLKRSKRADISEDIKIFEFARRKIQEEIDGLVQKDPNVRYQLNLETIREQTEEIKALKDAQERSRSARAELAQIKQKLENGETISEIKAKIQEEQAKLNEANERILATNAQEKIEQMTLELARKSRILAKLEEGKIATQEQYQSALELQ